MAPYLYDNFEIRGIYALGEPYDGDGSERFVCFISGNESGLWTAENLEKRIKRQVDTKEGIPVSVDIFDDMDVALDYASETLNFELSPKIQAFRDRSKEIFEKFGYATATETEQFMTFTALASNGMLALTRGLLDEVQIPVVVLMAKGSDKVLIKPLAILMTDEILEKLEMPTEMSNDEDDE